MKAIYLLVLCLAFAGCDHTATPVEQRCSITHVREARSYLECADKLGCKIDGWDYSWARNIQRRYPECWGGVER
jgi:hypothetical protein